MDEYTFEDKSSQKGGKVASDKLDISDESSVLELLKDMQSNLDISDPTDFCILLCTLIDLLPTRLIESIKPHLDKALERVQAPQTGEQVCLTPREMEVLNWAAAGKTAWEMGVIIGISQRTVKYYLANCYRKLGVSNRTQAIMTAMQANILSTTVGGEVQVPAKSAPIRHQATSKI